MHKRGESVLTDNAIYLILLVMFIAGMFYFLLEQGNGSDIWGDYFAKEIAKTIDFAKPGDEICLDVHKATEIAKKSKLESFSEIFKIDNANNEVCVKLSLGRQNCVSYFNNVDVVNVELKLAGGKNENGEDINIFCFNIVEKGGKNA